MSDAVGLLILVLLSVLLIVFTIVEKKRPFVLKDLPAFQRLRRAIGLAVEDGKRIHVALGRGTILSENFAAALVGLGALKRLTTVALIGDHPPIATSGEGNLMILARNCLQGAYRRLGIPPQDLSQKALMIGATPLSYAVGSQMEIRDGNVTVDLLIGHLGNEAALICDASQRQGNLCIAGSDNLTAQAVFAAAATHPLLGEDVFAAVAYMDGDAVQRASLRTQDIARWAIILFLVLASLAKLVGL